MVREAREKNTLVQSPPHNDLENNNDNNKYNILNSDDDDDDEGGLSRFYIGSHSHQKQEQQREGREFSISILQGLIAFVVASVLQSCIWGAG